MAYIVFGDGKTEGLEARGDVAGVLGAVELGDVEAEEKPLAKGLAVLNSVRAPVS